MYHTFYEIEGIKESFSQIEDVTEIDMASKTVAQEDKPKPGTM